nr:MAG TPA: hypothetical protein [Caudoviricetes sp.]
MFIICLQFVHTIVTFLCYYGILQNIVDYKNLYTREWFNDCH